MAEDQRLGQKIWLLTKMGICVREAMLVHAARSHLCVRRAVVFILELANISGLVPKCTHITYNSDIL